MSARFQPLDSLPLFASEEAIATALLGTGNAVKWRNLAPLLERQGLPRIDPELGGRYIPAVKAFFDNKYGLISSPPLATQDGTERFDDGWKRNARKRPV